MSKKRQSSRRDFLSGKAAVDRVLDWTDTPLTDQSAPEVRQHLPPAPYLMHLARRAMACDFQIYFNARQYPQATDAALAALDLIEQLEAQMTVYRDTSEVISINQRAYFEPVAVEPGLFELLQQAMQIYDHTGGAYDITSGHLSRAWGFFRRAGTVPSGEELAAALAKTGSRHVQLNAADRTIRFLHPELEINLNSIGKGYAIDRACDRLEMAEVEDFLFHGGQSSVVARGSQSGSAHDAWTIGLRHPLRAERRLAEFHLRNRSLSTSGTGRQFFHHQGRRYGHILDPRTGQPASGVYSATVISRSAALCDALSTAFYVMGPDAALDYCQGRDDVGMLMVTPGEKQGSVRLVSTGLADDEWSLLEA